MPIWLSNRVRASNSEYVERSCKPPLCRWKVRLLHELNPTARLSRVLDSDRVLFSNKYWESVPDFSAEPTATPISRREAAEALGRELLNRRSEGRLLARYHGRVPALFIDLSGALSRARCFRVSVGPYQATADLIERLVSEPSAVAPSRERPRPRRDRSHRGSEGTGSSFARSRFRPMSTARERTPSANPNTSRSNRSLGMGPSAR